MTYRIFLGFLALLALASSLVLVLTHEAVRRGAVAEITRRLEISADTAASILGVKPAPETARELARTLDARVTVIDRQGRVLADSQSDPETMENLSDLPEVKTARREGKGIDIRRNAASGGEMAYFARADPATGLVIRTALALSAVERGLAGFYTGLAVAFAATAAVGAIGSVLLARWIARPLGKIRAVAESISAGNFVKAPLGGSDEIGRVGAAINRMAEELRVRMETLNQERARLEALISGMEEGVVAIDGEGSILHLNSAAGGLLRLDGGAVGLKVWEALRLPGLQNEVQRTLQEGSRARWKGEIGPRIVSIGISSTKERQGAVLVAQDATEQHRYDTLRKEFVANVSHELRTPLSLILGFVETLKEGAWQDPKLAPEFLETIERHARRLENLIQDLLELSRLESAAQLVKPTPIQVAVMLLKIRETFAPLAEKKKQELTLENPPDDVIDADPEMIERAVGNLVDNAIKYTPEGGKIQIRARREPHAAVFLVQDNGPGIPKEDLPKMFGRFFRVDKSRSRGLGGTGLGLAIVKHIAQLHGGSAWVESEPGRGSVFGLKIPRR